ncbi:MAG: hypothetical protein ABI760_23650, partial [Ferruginibacter sp.]
PAAIVLIYQDISLTCLIQSINQLTNQKRIFNSELDNICLRHSMFFTMDKKRFIRVIKTGNSYQLKLLPGIFLPQAIIMEIELAFKLSIPADGSGSISGAPK